MVGFPYWEILTVNCLQHCSLHFYQLSHTARFGIKSTAVEMAITDCWKSFYICNPFTDYQWENQSKNTSFWWGECSLQQLKRRALVNAAAGEGSKIIDSALFSMAWAWDSMHVLPTLIKKKMWEVMSIPANPILQRGLWAAVNGADNSRDWNFKGQWKVRRHLLDISFSAQESAFGLWLIHNLEKSSSYWFSDYRNSQNMFQF